jgi:hypothetical protein
MKLPFNRPRRKSATLAPTVIPALARKAMEIAVAKTDAQQHQP